MLDWLIDCVGGGWDPTCKLWRLCRPRPRSGQVLNWSRIMEELLLQECCLWNSGTFPALFPLDTNTRKRQLQVISVTRTSPIERVVALICFIRWNHLLHVPPRTTRKYLATGTAMYSTSSVHSWIWQTAVNRSSAHLGKALATCKHQSFQTMKMRCVGQCAETVFCWWSLLMTSTEVCTGVCIGPPIPTCQEEDEAADKRVSFA